MRWFGVVSAADGGAKLARRMRRDIAQTVKTMTIDLFGAPDLPPSKAKRKPTPRRGYAAPPGTGPAGETCGSCAHHATRRFAKVYHKCALMVARWTGGAGSDVLLKSPACKRWAPLTDDAE